MTSLMKQKQQVKHDILQEAKTREREFITNAILYNVYRGREEGWAWAKAARPDLTAPYLDSPAISGLDISGLTPMALNATPVPISRDHLHVVDGIRQWLSSPDESPLFPYRGWDKRTSPNCSEDEPYGTYRVVVKRDPDDSPSGPSLDGDLSAKGSESNDNRNSGLGQVISKKSPYDFPSSSEDGNQSEDLSDDGSEFDPSVTLDLAELTRKIEGGGTDQLIKQISERRHRQRFLRSIYMGPATSAAETFLAIMRDSSSSDNEPDEPDDFDFIECFTTTFLRAMSRTKM